MLARLPARRRQLELPRAAVLLPYRHDQRMHAAEQAAALSSAYPASWDQFHVVAVGTVTGEELLLWRA